MSFRLFLAWLNPGTLPVEGEGEPCGMNGAAAKFAALWMGLLAERARTMRCDPRLVTVAQNHAAYLSGRVGEEAKQSMHIGSGGTTANQRVRQGGYHLPAWHGDNNTVECCDGHKQEAADALTSLMGSDSHRPALLGQGFWEDSVVFGVGSAGGFWVILVCPPEASA